MPTLNQLLEAADPIRHEPPLPEEQWQRMRQTVIRRASMSDAPPMRSRLAFAGAVAATVVGGGVLGRELWEHAFTPVMAAVRFEVRLAEEQPAPGLTVAQVPGSNRLIYLHPEIVVSNDDIAQSAVTESSPGTFGVSIALLPAGAARMQQATTNHVGRPVAILIDGQVALAPVLRSPIHDLATLTGGYTRAEAERIAEGMMR